MYISKYVFNPHCGAVSKLSDAESMHKFVWGFFQDMTDFSVSRANLGILYKVQEVKGQIFLVIQSKVKPNTVPSDVTEIYSVTDDVMKEKLQNSQEVGFQVFVNPTWINPDTKKRLALGQYEKRIEWIKNYMFKNGCVVTSVDEKDFYYQSCNKGNNPFKIGISNMCGRVQITDFEKFYAMVLKGIGRSRSYGAGLFTFGV